MHNNGIKKCIAKNSISANHSAIQFTTKINLREKKTRKKVM